MLPLDFYLSQHSRLPAAPTGDLLTGQTVILTGANSGIGLEIAHHITALRPERLILAVRDPKNATDALTKVLKRSPAGVQVDLWELDLERFESVKAFAKQCEALGKVDILLSNAGRQFGFGPAPMKKTVDGHECIHQINVLSQILLLCLLHPLLLKSSGARVVFTTSDAHPWAETEPIARSLKETGSIIKWADDEKDFVNETRYFQSKLLLQMVIRSLIPHAPYQIVSANPGLCRTNLGRDFKLDNLSAIPLVLWFLTNARSPEVGARSITHAIFAEDSHEYWSDCEAKAAPSIFMASKTGKQATLTYWREVKDVVESVSPGCTKWLHW